MSTKAPTVTEILIAAKEGRPYKDMFTLLAHAAGYSNVALHNALNERLVTAPPEHAYSLSRSVVLTMTSKGEYIRIENSLVNTERTKLLHNSLAELFVDRDIENYEELRQIVKDVMLDRIQLRLDRSVIRAQHLKLNPPKHYKPLHEKHKIHQDFINPLLDGQTTYDGVNLYMELIKPGKLGCSFTRVLERVNIGITDENQRMTHDIFKFQIAQTGKIRVTNKITGEIYNDTNQLIIKRLVNELLHEKYDKRTKTSFITMQLEFLKTDIKIVNDKKKQANQQKPELSEDEELELQLQQLIKKRSSKPSDSHTQDITSGRKNLKPSEHRLW